MHKHEWSGQGLVEYALIIVLAIVVLAVAIHFLGPTITNFINPPQSPTPSAIPVIRETSTPTVDIILGEVKQTEETLERIVDINEIRLPNCNGSSELSVTKALTKTVTKHISIGEEGSLDLIPLITLDTLQLHIAKSANVETGVEISDSTSVEVRAAPGTTVIYQVAWVETSTQGLVEVQAGNDIYFVPYYINNSLKADIREPTRELCPTQTP